MTVGWHVRVLQTAVIPCPLVLLLAGCAPPPGVSAAPPDALAVAGAPAIPYTNGRLFALGQMLAREQQRSASLQEQLDQRGQEVAQLRTAVEQLRERENELRADLERATATAAAEAAAPQRANEAAGSPDAEGGGPVTPQPIAAQGSTGEEDPGRTADQATQAALVASLRTALSEEQEHRRRAEMQLVRLKEETSAPLFAPSEPSDADQLAAARQEIADLRTALADERATRERLAEDFRALQERAAQDAARVQDDPPQSAELRGRLERLQAEQEAAVNSFNRSLAASEARVADLEHQLAAARASASGAGMGTDGNGTGNGDGTAIRAENAALRLRLDEEHRRTKELANKLKLATRVTELIFKMQAQQTAAAAPQGRMPRLQAPPQPEPWLDR